MRTVSHGVTGERATARSRSPPAHISCGSCTACSARARRSLRFRPASGSCSGVLVGTSRRSGLPARTDSRGSDLRERTQVEPPPRATVLNAPHRRNARLHRFLTVPAADRASGYSRGGRPASDMVCDGCRRPLAHPPRLTRQRSFTETSAPTGPRSTSRCSCHLRTRAARGDRPGRPR